ncbi:hypothetical protein Hte_008192 [Hypoxylon texense]
MSTLPNTLVLYQRPSAKCGMDWMCNPYQDKQTAPPWRWESSTEKSRWSTLFEDYPNRPGPSVESRSNGHDASLPGLPTGSTTLTSSPSGSPTPPSQGKSSRVLANSNNRARDVPSPSPSPTPSTGSNAPASPSSSGSPETPSSPRPSTSSNDSNDSNWGRDLCLAMTNAREDPFVAHDNPSPEPSVAAKTKTTTTTTRAEEEQKPELTWDPTIWAPHDPDSFHPPGLASVAEARQHGQHMAALLAARLDSDDSDDDSDSGGGPVQPPQRQQQHGQHGQRCAHCVKMQDRRHALRWRSLVFVFYGWHAIVRAAAHPRRHLCWLTVKPDAATGDDDNTDDSTPSPLRLLLDLLNREHDDDDTTAFD